MIYICLIHYIKEFYNQNNFFHFYIYESKIFFSECIFVVIYGFNVIYYEKKKIK